ncbi:unnamed protein product [Clonostachys rhizophaga]|uniref:DUF2264 domain-containing protein n=1 Tax=Clonostachys rhizophaga TaxID=160324 RepID=A0A9N9YMF4_9HYPO|nr:unnamed protein product [Clonostachys rhizophaga]
MHLGINDVHPFCQIELKDRASVQDLLRAVLDPLEPFFSTHKARVNCPGNTAVPFDQSASELEGFARPLWGLTFLLGGHGEYHGTDWWIQAYKSGTDPKHPEYWGYPTENDQRLALAEANVIWDSLSQKERQNVEAWLGNSINERRLKKNGGKFSQDRIDSDIKHLDSFYRGDGWSNDGPEGINQMDYYSSSFAIQFLQLLYAKVAGDEDPERAAEFKKRAQIAALDLVHYYDNGGRAIPYGRSMGYRFAIISFWGALAYANVELPAPLTWGKGDHVIDAKDVTSTLHGILHTQRSIIKDVYGSETGENPEVLALYKEVLTQYDQGLEIPDDVTLLFADGNQGSIRRVLVGDEKSRSGGAGIYYHFEFVGHPRSYKWLNSNHLPKAWQQLDEAYNNGVDRIWIFNVGDIKPMESFFDAFIDNTFSLSTADSKECSQLFFEYDQLMGLGKHECIEDDTFSVIYYDEVDTVLRRWSDLLGRSTLIYEKVPADLKPAIYQLIHHPIKATQIYIALRVALGKNKRFAEQRRTIANKYAQEVLRLFQPDFDLSN